MRHNRHVAPLFIAVMLGATTGAAQTAPAATGDSAYRTMLSQLHKGDTTIDFRAMRIAYAHSSSYSPVSRLEKTLHDRMTAAVGESDIKRVGVLADSLLAMDPLDIEAHVLRVAAAREAGDSATMHFHAAVARGLIRSLDGDHRGATVDAPIQVISLQEEKAYGRAKHLEYTGNYNTANCGQGVCDAVRFHREAGGDTTIYFDITLPTESMASAYSAQDTLGVPDCPTARDQAAKLWCQGGDFFTSGEYTKAIAPYSKAFEIEKQHRSLSRAAWLVLVDNLGMAYGITHNLQKAREIFEYGITKEPTYPMFFYNLACAYAEMGDEPRAIENLKRAFQYRANMIPGEEIPDPATDDSFQRFMHDQQFLDALKALPGRS